ncbi:putative membrane protein [Wickerhamomyces ciferrii]|uniref:Membrane protein n=1 Tax=Wickerhamomyces ciferrii (strain ATCC 14091 / BCRC 22168 / CBS 111 / JCM 3599 / NBRC 0793 / NRRL Y-1031 F-60-10) TaxID=1206466 RepID=K0KRI3_WICCF|nr:uncharacterized protein BN7_3459 [Wickerhamomyces ciferrii]CCH43904.1 putative membrane protein [Wickerhamomyces ciferrii]
MQSHNDQFLHSKSTHNNSDDILEIPAASYSTESIPKNHNTLESHTENGNIASVLNIEAERISLVDNGISDHDRSSDKDDYVEFDLGHEDYKSGIFTSDRLRINKQDSFKAKLVKSGKNVSNDKAEQLFKDETISSVFVPPKLEIVDKASDVNYLESGMNSLNVNSHADVKVNDQEVQDKSAHGVLDDNDEDKEWMHMETAADDEVYDEKGKFITLKDDSVLKEDPLLGVSSGYTRIAAEEQAELYKEANKKTDFLFKDKSGPRRETKLSPQDYSDIYDEEEDLEEFDNNNQYNSSQTPLSQLQTTKKLFKDEQKFAYIGLVKLVMNDMATNLAKQCVSSKSRSKRSKWAKRINLAQATFGQWQYLISDRLYSHLELSEEEKQMVESLSSHGISPEDLSRSLRVRDLVDNPAYDKDAHKVEKAFKEGDVLKPDDIACDQQIEIDVAWTVLCDLFLVLLADSVYDSRSRTLLQKFGDHIGLSELDIHQFERRITSSLQMEDATEQVWDEKEHLESRKKRAKKKKLMYVGMATIGGSLVLGLSAGLLAPVIGAGIAAGLTTVGISGTTGFLAGTGGTALVTATGTAIGARIGSRGMNNRVGDVKTFEFIPFHNNRRVNLIITVSGWMNSKADDIRLPFSTIDPVMGDLYSLLWEPELLQSTGQTIGILATEAITQSVQQILGATILMALMSAVQIPMALSKLGYLLDNPWNVSLDRAWKAGLILADTLISRNLGVRPVTLVGFSLGSRVIFSCLLELAKRGAFGLVEKVILFGSPLVVSNDDLALARSAVSGRYINGYSRKDWILGYLFRATSGGLRRVTGLSPIEKFHGIENFDCTPYVHGHMEYRKAMPQLLSLLEFRVLSEEFVEIDDPDPEQTERQRELISEFDEARKQMELEKANGKKKSIWNKWFGPKKKDWWSVYPDASDKTDEYKDNKEFGFDVDDVMREAEQLRSDTIPKDDSQAIINEPQKTHSSNDTDSITSNKSSTDHKSDLISNELNTNSKIPIDVHHEKDVKQNINDSDMDDEFSTKENITMSFS